MVVALSGGGDSVALLFALREIGPSEGFHLVGAAHLNHQLRGSDGDADEEFCVRLAAELDIPLHIERRDVGALARAAAVSVEQAAHDARHDFYAAAASRFDAVAVAVAHTTNDQAETFLLRLLRGAGPRGLSGMHPRSGIVVRPFLESSRAEIRAFLEARGIAFREDATNDDRTIPRNLIRHELLPFLEGRFSAGIVDILNREAVIAREDGAYLDSAAGAVAERLILHVANHVEISIDDLLAQPPAIARRVIRRAQQMASGGLFVGFDDVEAVLLLAGSNRTGPVDLPGHRVNRRGRSIVLTNRTGRAAPDAPIEFSYELDIPGRVRVPEAACAISADIRAVPSGESATRLWPLAGRSDEVVLEGDRLTRPLAVRNRRPGDRFRPLGFAGRKKLQDLFVDAKVERAVRDTIPVIVDSTGQIVWVAGHAPADEFRVTDCTRAVVILKRVPI